MKYKICHLTTVHNRYDPRIFYKECISLQRAGYDVSLIAADNESNVIKDGIKIINVGRKSQKRLYRVFISTFMVFKIARKLNADIYHFHDPELIPYMFILKIMGKKIIYDVHEDYFSSIRQKEYIPHILRLFISRIYFIVDRLFTKRFNIILAEKCYKYMYPDGVFVLNYPRAEHFNFERKNLGNKLIYTGNVTEKRGAFIYAEILKRIETVDIYLIGRCSKNLADKLFNIVNGSKRLVIKGVNSYIDYKVILESYRDESLLAGLILFPEEGAYKGREPTKIFEYMAAGLPVICSNFPAWENIVKEHNCGICVDPLNINEIVRVIYYLLDNPKEAKIMGENGRKAVFNKYNWALGEKALIGLYNKLLRFENN